MGYLSRASSLLDYSQSCPHAAWPRLFHLMSVAITPEQTIHVITAMFFERATLTYLLCPINIEKVGHKLAGVVGIEPTTEWLTVTWSTADLHAKKATDVYTQYWLAWRIGLSCDRLEWRLVTFSRMRELNSRIWYPDTDSNRNQEFWRLVCFHYTIAGYSKMVGPEGIEPSSKD